jgi:hypothetical protein
MSHHTQKHHYAKLELYLILEIAISILIRLTHELGNNVDALAATLTRTPNGEPAGYHRGAEVTEK